MNAPPSTIAIRFSRRELALVCEAVEFMALPEDPDDQRLVLELRELLEREVAELGKPLSMCAHGADRGSYCGYCGGSSKGGAA